MDQILLCQPYMLEKSDYSNSFKKKVKKCQLLFNVFKAQYYNDYLINGQEKN